MSEYNKAIKIVKKKLKSDPDLWLAFKANIAMAFYDEYRREGNNLSHSKVHKVANKAAHNFLKLLTS